MVYGNRGHIHMYRRVCGIIVSVVADDAKIGIFVPHPVDNFNFPALRPHNIHGLIYAVAAKYLDAIPRNQLRVDNI